MTDYRISYLPIFSEDLNKAVEYISNVLLNPLAAYELIDEVETAIIKRSKYPEDFEKYPTNKKRKLDYYRIYVNDYVIYYVVYETPEGKVMEIRRLLHSLQDRESIL